MHLRTCHFTFTLTSLASAKQTRSLARNAHNLIAPLLPSSRTPSLTYTTDTLNMADDAPTTSATPLPDLPFPPELLFQIFKYCEEYDLPNNPNPKSSRLLRKHPMLPIRGRNRHGKRSRYPLHTLYAAFAWSASSSEMLPKKALR